MEFTRIQAINMDIRSRDRILLVLLGLLALLTWGYARKSAVPDVVAAAEVRRCIYLRTGELPAEI
jgi:hypothetical protein